MPDNFPNMWNLKKKERKKEQPEQKQTDSYRGHFGSCQLGESGKDG